MNKEFIPYEQALELKELGFYDYNIAWYVIVDEKPKIVFLNYGSHLCAPLYQQAFRWFREKYEILHLIKDETGLYEYQFNYRANHYYGVYETYEEAELACLKKLIEIAKNK